MGNVRFRRDGRVSVISICNETSFMLCSDYASISKHLKKIESDKGIDFIVIRGASSEIFTKGHNVEMLSNFDEISAKMYSASGQELIKTIKSIKKLVICEVSGVCDGPGFEIVLAADIVVAAKKSSFSFPETELGILPGFGGTQLLARRVHETFTKFLIMTGDSTDSLELYEKGIINKVFDNVEHMQEYTKKLTDKLAGRSIFTMGLAKETVNNGMEMDFDRALLFEQNAFTLSFAAKDKNEGMGAFINKTKPSFSLRWEDFEEL